MFVAAAFPKEQKTGNPRAIQMQGRPCQSQNVYPDGCGVSSRGAAETHSDVDNDSVPVSIGIGCVAIGSCLTVALLVWPSGPQVD